MNALIRPMFPHTFDSTMLALLRSCPQKFFRTYVEHWKPKDESVHLIAGGAFAKGVEVGRKAFYEGKQPVWESKQSPETGRMSHTIIAEVDIEPGQLELAQALGTEALMLSYGDFECPPESSKSLERVMGALDYYHMSYPYDTDPKSPIDLGNGRRGIEFSFAEPIDILHPTSGEPILYTGRADMIADFAGGVYVVDEKTTTSLGATWSRKWEMRAQFTGYIWACHKAGIKASGAIVRGVSILKTKFETQEAITNRSPYEIERWEGQTIRDIARAKRMWEEGYWDYALDNACDEYGGCNMVSICKSPNPESWLPMQFTKRVWDPLARKQVSVEEWEASWGHTS